MKFLLVILFLPYFTFADDFEKDLAALKSKYKDQYQIEEKEQWAKVVEKEESGGFSDKFHKVFRNVDLSYFFNYYFFSGTIPPDGQINGQISSSGPYLETRIKLLKAMDLFVYGNYGITSEATFQETTQNYPVPNNYLLGLGGYFSNDFNKTAPYFAFEVQGQSFVGVNYNLDYSTTNAISQLQGGQVTSLNMAVGLDFPFKIFEKPGSFRVYLDSAITGNFKLMDGSYQEDVSFFQGGFKLKSLLTNAFLLNFASTGGFYKGDASQSFVLLYLDLGFRF
jgi:hypothetical protein